MKPLVQALKDLERDSIGFDLHVQNGVFYDEALENALLDLGIKIVSVTDDQAMLEADEGKTVFVGVYKDMDNGQEDLYFNLSNINVSVQLKYDI